MVLSYEEWRDEIAEYLQKGIDLWLEVFAKEKAQEMILHYRADGGSIRAEIRTSQGWELLGYGDYEWEEAHIFGEPEDPAALSEWERERGCRVPEEVRDVIKDCGLGIRTMCMEFYQDSGGEMQERMAEDLVKVLEENYKCRVTAMREG